MLTCLFLGRYPGFLHSSKANCYRRILLLGLYFQLRFPPINFSKIELLVQLNSLLCNSPLWQTVQEQVFFSIWLLVYLNVIFGLEVFFKYFKTRFTAIQYNLEGLILNLASFPNANAISGLVNCAAYIILPNKALVVISSSNLGYGTKIL